MKKEWRDKHCLPEVCIRNVTLNKFMQRTVNDLVEVHCVLLLYKSRNRCWSVGVQYMPTFVTHAPYKAWAYSYMDVTKAFLMKAWL